MTRTFSGGTGTLKRRRKEKSTPFYREDDFWRGMASVFVSFKTFDPRYYRRNSQKADFEALQNDSEKIGMDFQNSIQHFEVKYPAMKKVRQERLFDPDKTEIS